MFDICQKVVVGNYMHDWVLTRLDQNRHVPLQADRHFFVSNLEEIQRAKNGWFVKVLSEI